MVCTILLFGRCYVLPLLKHNLFLVLSCEVKSALWMLWKTCIFNELYSSNNLQGQTVYFVDCEQIQQQGRSLWSSIVLSFSLAVLSKFQHVKKLSLNSRYLRTLNCAPIQCILWTPKEKKKLCFEFFVEQGRHVFCYLHSNQLSLFKVQQQIMI